MCFKSRIIRPCLAGLQKGLPSTRSLAKRGAAGRLWPWSCRWSRGRLPLVRWSHEWVAPLDSAERGAAGPKRGGQRCWPWGRRWGRAPADEAGATSWTVEEEAMGRWFGWWLMAGADLFWEKSTTSWLLVAGLLWEKSTTGWWLISQVNRVLTGEAVLPFCQTFFKGKIGYIASKEPTSRYIPLKDPLLDIYRPKSKRYRCLPFCYRPSAKSPLAFSMSSPSSRP
jgi:hypothetical protein